MKKDFEKKIEKETHIKPTQWQMYRKMCFNRRHYEKQLLGNFYDAKTNKYAFDKKKLPYNLKLYELICAYSYNCLVESNLEHRSLSLKNVLRMAKKNYCKLNIADPDFLKLIRKDNRLIILDDESDNDVGLISIASVNKLVSNKALTDSRRGKRKQGSDEIENYENILDNLKIIKGYDMFVMSELSLPWNMLEVFLKFSADNQVGFVAGMEYLNLNNTVYNFVVTCLPFEKNHVKDCLPIFRLKKHYAPIEKSVLERESFSLPVDKNKWFDMFKWKGMCFTVLNCFELTNVRARASFVSKIDTLITIAYNMDITYYDNLAESTSRDLYCYVVLNNVSQHGSSQIVAPKKQENKILLKVIRGTTEKNQTTIETADLDIRGLRLFQKYGENNKEEFKPLPAGFNRNVARLNNV